MAIKPEKVKKRTEKPTARIAAKDSSMPKKSKEDEDEEEVADDWEKQEEEDNWDPDFEEFDLPKSKGKKSGTKKRRS